MEPTMNQADHDLLIVIAEGQKELKTDVKAMSDALREMKATIDATREQQREQDNRLTNLTATVTGLKLDRDVDRKDISAVKSDIDRWKLYIKIAAVLASPFYLMLVYVAEQTLHAWLFP